MAMASLPPLEHRRGDRLQRLARAAGGMAPRRRTASFESLRAKATLSSRAPVARTSGGGAARELGVEGASLGEAPRAEVAGEGPVALDREEERIGELALAEVGEH